MVAVRVLALDISLRSTGWAVGSPDSRPIWGIIKNPRGGEWDNNGEHLVLARFRKFLADHHAHSQLTHIFFENIFVDTGTDRFQWNGTDAQLQYKGVVLEFCGTHGVKPSEPTVVEWRSRFLGKDGTMAIREGETRANTDARRKEWKRAVTIECSRRGWFVETNDEADALGILDYALCVVDSRYAGRTDPIFRRNQLRDERERYFGQ